MTRAYMAIEDRLEQLCAVVQAEPFSTAEEIAHEVGLRPAHVRKYLRLLWTSGRLEMRSHGPSYVWSVPQVSQARGAPRSHVSAADRRAQVRAVIAARAPVGTKAIASELGISIKHTREYVNQLMQAGELHCKRAVSFHKTSHQWSLA